MFTYAMRPSRITTSPRTPPAQSPGWGSRGSPARRRRTRSRSGAAPGSPPAGRRADRTAARRRARRAPRASTNGRCRAPAPAVRSPGRRCGTAGLGAGRSRRRRVRARSWRGSPSAQLVVEAVALHRGAARVAYEPDELGDLLLGAGARARRLEDLLPHDRALDVVGAEVERDLGEREAHHDPVRLHVRDVVEQQPRDGEHLQVVSARREPEAAPLEDGVLGVEGERDEGEEATRLVLLVAQPQQVVDALLVGLDVAVEHGALGRDPELVRGVVDVEPLVGVLLAGRDEGAHAVGEDLSAAARHRVEAGVPQRAQDLLVRAALEPRYVVDLGRRVELEMDVRQRLLQLAQKAGVVLEVDVRVLAVDRVDLSEAVELVLRDRVLDELVGGQRERVLLLPRLGEGAELALHATDVRLVQVDVLDEVDLVAAAALPAREVGEVAEREQVVGLHESDAVVEVEPFAREHLLPDGCECVEGVQNGHQCSVQGWSRVSSERKASEARTQGASIAKAIGATE